MAVKRNWIDVLNALKAIGKEHLMTEYFEAVTASVEANKVAIAANGRSQKAEDAIFKILKDRCDLSREEEIGKMVLAVEAQNDRSQHQVKPKPPLSKKEYIDDMASRGEYDDADKEML